jgi:rubrerythrin
MTNTTLSMGCAFSMLLLMIASPGCKEKPREPEHVEPTVTLENLQLVYDRELRRQQMFTEFADRAQRERFPNLASLYRAAARSEAIHAERHAQLLRARGVEPIEPPKDSVIVGTTIQTLRKAISGEQLEIESVYPNLIRTAELEKFPEAVEHFTKTREADIRHLDLLREALERQGRIQRVQYALCPGCGYIMTTRDIDSCPNCTVPKDQFEHL